MEIVNVKEVEEQIYRKGFPKEMVDEVLQQAKQGVLEPATNYAEMQGKDHLEFKVHFRIDDKAFKAYLNSFDLTLTTPDAVRSQNFSNYHRITAREAYRMLKFGELVAVNKDLYNKENEKYNVWIQLDLEDPKDANGNCILKTFHQNYYQKQPFDLKEGLIRLLPLFPKLKKSGELEKFEKRLKKAYLIAANGQLGGKKVPMLLSVNPEERLIEVYDRNMNLLNQTAEFKKQLQAPSSDEASQQQNKGIKP